LVAPVATKQLRHFLAFIISGCAELDGGAERWKISKTRPFDSLRACSTAFAGL